MPHSLVMGFIISIYKFVSHFIMYNSYSNAYTSNSYGELQLDDCNVWDFDFPLTAEEYEDAVNDQIGQAEAYYENQIADYYSC